MRFSVLLAGLATSFAFSGPVLADSQGDLDQCRFVGAISKADQGIAACDRVIQDSKVTGPARATSLSNRCGWWWAKNDADRALADCNEAIKVNGAYAPAYINRGNAYLSKGDFEHAFGDFDEAIRLDPKSAWAYGARGDLYKAKGDFDHALADFNAAVRLDPTYAIAYSFRGDLYKRKGDFERAMSDLNELIRLDPNDAKPIPFGAACSISGAITPPPWLILTGRSGSTPTTLRPTSAGGQRTLSSAAVLRTRKPISRRQTSSTRRTPI